MSTLEKLVKRKQYRLLKTGYFDVASAIVMYMKLSA